jgi:hypothetical protein
MRIRFAILVIAFVAGCADAEPESGVTKCSADPLRRCPSAYECVDGLCWKDGDVPNRDAACCDSPTDGLNDRAVTDAESD